MWSIEQLEDIRDDCMRDIFVIFPDVSVVVENIIVARLLQKESLFLKEILRGAAPFLRSADTTFEEDDVINQKEERSMNMENDDYYSVARRKEVREES